MKIYHAADIHLGRNRLDGRLPDQDMAEAFRQIAEAAVKDQADVFVLAGDLFDRPQVEPAHLRQAQEVLRILQRSNIPVVAIEGNHDKASVHAEDATWVGYLADDGLLELLRPQFGPSGAVLAPWDPATRRGAFVDHGGVRFVGGGYLGAATPAKVRQILTALDGGGPRVLLLHAGPDYFVGEGGGFSKEDLAAMRQQVAYLALGHIHKPMTHEGWACNPGSPEHCDLREADYSRRKDGVETARGYAVIELDPQAGRVLKLEIRSNPRRPVHRAELDCSPFGNKLKGGAAALVQAAVKVIEQLNPEPTAVIDLRLVGHLNLNRIALDQEQASVAISHEAGVFAVSLDVGQLGEPTRTDGAIVQPILSREEMERQALLRIVADEPFWGLTEEREAFAALFLELKDAIRANRDEAVVAELIAASALVEKIRAAKEALAAGQAAVAAAPPTPGRIASPKQPSRATEPGTAVSGPAGSARPPHLEGTEVPT